MKTDLKFVPTRPVYKHLARATPRVHPTLARLFSRVRLYNTTSDGHFIMARCPTRLYFARSMCARVRGRSAVL